METLLFGCCAPIDQARAARTAGFDYMECPLTSLLPEESEEAFAPVYKSYRRAPMPTWAFNIFLPADLKVVGPAVDEARLAGYVQTALRRAARIGARLIVFGSGRSRMIPEGYPRQKALEQLVRFLNMVADVAKEHEITIAIEPLNRRESNVINSLAEAADLARRVNHRSVQMLADFYHMDEEAEPLEEIRKHADWLGHIHVADTGRLAPGTGQYPYLAFAQQLWLSGYVGMVSVECQWRDFAAEARPAVEFLRCTL